MMVKLNFSSLPPVFSVMWSFKKVMEAEFGVQLLSIITQLITMNNIINVETCFIVFIVETFFNE